MKEPTFAEMRAAFLDFIVDGGFMEHPDGDTDDEGRAVDCTTYTAAQMSRYVFDEFAEMFGFSSDANGFAWDKIQQALDEDTALLGLKPLARGE